eukprot:TRINITY_DN307_c0_g1_i1.p1 TRINITY_DN307_c0_g1~~TRINITY_DN307_c0_g1_i1.p1  ORF type:complete len:948 (+),score=380.23 TRINITY_DN307_c0_g1_i1:112-2955(+)
MASGNENKLEWPVQRVRQTFIDFFVQKKAHTFIPSSPVVPYDDPTLLFTNAGMNQFKPIFLGTIDPKNPMSKLKRAANSQKCIRAGGKHNDLEDVGKDTYHHTFFEMLGNWSFGDYFKKDAIEWAWELLTRVYGLPAERLYATYFGGFGNVPADEEARKIWLQFLPAERVLPFGMKENFWEMGETGPCGPCTEIHFDLLGNRDAAKLVNYDDPTVIEIWNNVFIQFNRETDKSLRPLPAQHVDTGMGLERITCILQNKLSNYDTDVFSPIFDAIQKATGAAPYGGKLGAEDVNNVDMAYRVVADHIRTLTFAIADGAVPSSEGRGYVLRRVLRRGVRYGKQVLKGKSGFFSQLVAVVVEQMKGIFPEIEKNYQNVMTQVQSEERLFERTLDKGIEHFEKAAATIPQGTKTFPGKEAFKLYDTYGFPVDLTQLMAEEKGLTVGKEEYETLMNEAKEKSRQAAKSGGDGTMKLGAEATAALQQKNIAPTDDNYKYVLAEIDGTIKAIWDGKQFVEEATVGGTYGLVLDRTNFYAEGGGQVHDSGFVTSKTGLGKFDVNTVQTFAGYCLHSGKLSDGVLKVGDSVELQIDHVRRKPIMSNHTSTHILNYALRSVLGEHIDQKGSLVDHEKLRFDFSHPKGASPEELHAIENIAAELIARNLQVYRQSVSLKDAKSINGLRAVFGEVYPDPVTVVSIGASIEEMLKDPAHAQWKTYSIEFCGGTHITNTSEAKSFVIMSEGAIAAGIRRIVAFTGDAAAQAAETGMKFKQRIAEAKTKTGDSLNKELSTLKEDLKSLAIPVTMKPILEKEINNLRASVDELQKNLVKQLSLRGEELAQRSIENNSTVIIEKVDAGMDKKALDAVMQVLKKKLPEAAILLISCDDKKVQMIAYVGKNLQAKIGADEWVKEVAAVCGGKGGGKKENAMGSGEDASKADEAMKRALLFAAEKTQ